MSNAVNVVAEAELSDGILAVVEDALTKDVFHVYKKDKNVQPNHDAKGVMRYLMHVLHAMGYKVDKAGRDLYEEKEKVKKLELKIKILEQFIDGFEHERYYTNIVPKIGDWEIAYSTDNAYLYRHKDHEKDKWIKAESVDKIIEVIHKPN